MDEQKNSIAVMQIIYAAMIMGIIAFYFVAYSLNPKTSENPLESLLQYLFLPPIIVWFFKSIMIRSLKKKRDINAADMFIPYLVVAAICEATAILALVSALTSGFTTLTNPLVLFALCVMIINFPRQRVLRG